MIPSLEEIFTDKSRGDYFKGTLLSLDPGETTGYSVFKCNGMQAPNLEEQGQLDTKDEYNAANNLEILFDRIKPNHIVYEDYKVYAHKTESHANADLFTPQVIGMIKFLCIRRGILPSKHMAVLAKGFVTDDKLKAWGFYIKGKRHARDAIRHAIYYMLFTHFSKKEKERQNAYISKNSTPR